MTRETWATREARDLSSFVSPGSPMSKRENGYDNDFRGD